MHTRVHSDTGSQLPTTEPGKTTEDGTDTWAPLNIQETRTAVLDFQQMDVLMRVCSHIHLKSAYQISKPLINMNSMSNSSPINLAMQIKQKILLKYSEILYFCNTVASPLFESGEKFEHLR